MARPDKDDDFSPAIVQESERSEPTSSGTRRVSDLAPKEAARELAAPYSLVPGRKNVPLTFWQRSKQRGVVLYRLSTHALSSRSWWIRSALTIAQFAVLAYPLARGGHWKSAAFAIFLQFIKSYRDNSPKNMQLVSRNYVERKVQFYVLLQDLFALGRPSRGHLSESQVRSYQVAVLRLIAAFVRDHRNDSNGGTIFANLLVQDGDDIVVVARDPSTAARRPTKGRYAREDMLASEVFETGEHIWTGDIRRAFPNTTSRKSYRSVLVIPVILGSDRVVGAVSIDSSRAHHFDLDHEELVQYLAPYVALLAWTLNSNGPSLPSLPPESNKEE